MLVDVERFRYNSTFVSCILIAAEGQSGKMASDIKVYAKYRCVIEFSHSKIVPTDIHQQLLNAYREQILNVDNAFQL